MGHGSYSTTARATRATDMAYYTAPASEIFENNFNNAMNPSGVKMRESRDSVEHPNSVAIIIALDVTGSMGSVPHHLVKDGLPTMVDSIIKAGIRDPQILFLGIGDHTCDKAPLQVGQFESSDELLDKWLTTVYLEGGGGGNDGESYHLAWYFASRHTAVDCWDKRKQKGILFTIGDEPCLNSVGKGNLKGIMGPGQYWDADAESLLKSAQERFECFHINVAETSSGSRPKIATGWKKLVGDNRFFNIARHDQIANRIALSVANCVEGADTDRLLRVEE